MFQQNIPEQKKAEWSRKMMTLLGMALVEKLAFYNNLKYRYKYQNAFRQSKVNQYFHFMIDKELPTQNNVCFGFMLTLKDFNEVFLKDFRESLVSTNRFIMDETQDGVVTQFQFKNAPNNLLSENIEYLANLMVSMFFKFICVPQRKSYNKIVRNSIANLSEQVLNHPEQLDTIFQSFDQSNFLIVPEEKVEKQKHYLYQNKVKEIISVIVKEMKQYLFDGLDAKYVMMK
jgi:hypothetical protein